MTHEYVIALGGRVLCADGGGEPVPTAIAWAANSILAVGSDDAVTSISRGDSVFLDLAGCAVTPAPSDPDAAERLLLAAVGAGRPFDLCQLLVEAGFVERDVRLDPGARCDLAIWSADPRAVPSDMAVALRLVAVVRAGAFTVGDQHRGPLDPVMAPGRRREPLA